MTDGPLPPVSAGDVESGRVALKNFLRAPTPSYRLHRHRPPDPGVWVVVFSSSDRPALSLLLRPQTGESPVGPSCAPRRTDPDRFRGRGAPACRAGPAVRHPRTDRPDETSRPAGPPDRARSLSPV